MLIQFTTFKWEHILNQFNNIRYIQHNKDSVSHLPCEVPTINTKEIKK